MPKILLAAAGRTGAAAAFKLDGFRQVRKNSVVDGLPAFSPESTVHS